MFRRLQRQIALFARSPRVPSSSRAVKNGTHDASSSDKSHTRVYFSWNQGACFSTVNKEISLRQTRIVSSPSRRRLGHNSTSRCKHLDQDVCPRCLWHWHFLPDRHLTALVFPPGEHSRWNLVGHSYAKIHLRVERPPVSSNLEQQCFLSQCRPGLPYRGLPALKSQGDDMLLPALPAHWQSHFG